MKRAEVRGNHAYDTKSDRVQRWMISRCTWKTFESLARSINDFRRVETSLAPKR
jgi:hypothetical protein